MPNDRKAKNRRAIRIQVRIWAIRFHISRSRFDGNFWVWHGEFGHVELEVRRDARSVRMIFERFDEDDNGEGEETLKIFG